ncbi:MAG TPA: aspartate-semialdehyde dehydrogenase [Terriglobales bacterium]|nr:aspartate-semialdehyde dehydrogenase [Terriglobales bacterium]
MVVGLKIMTAKIPVGILGATGTVGQRFIQLLEDHPWFEVAWLAASERSSGQSYRNAARWRLASEIPARIADMKVSSSAPEGAPTLIFAALDAALATELEPRFAEAGHAVITNSSAFRMHEDVPLVIPEINDDHLALIEQQSWSKAKKNGGFIVTNSNCSIMGLAIALAPLADAFGIEKVFAVTMQAISGAGYPGVASLDILGNVIPYIAKEEEKMEAEAKKLLGKYMNGKLQMADFAISAQCNRVAVEDGHTESVSVKLRNPAKPEEIIAAWRSFKSKIASLALPSAPKEFIHYDEALDRPQPRLDIHRGKGMTTSIGRLRRCSVLDWKFTVLSHNTVRGAAGAAVLNAELLKVKGYLR